MPSLEYLISSIVLLGLAGIAAGRLPIPLPRPGPGKYFRRAWISAFGGIIGGSVFSLLLLSHMPSNVTELTFAMAAAYVVGHIFGVLSDLLYPSSKSN